MYHTGAVRLRKPLGDLDGNINRLIYWQGTAGDLLLERFALIAVHGDEEPTVRGSVNFVDRAYIMVLESRSRLRLAHEALFCRFVADKLGREELECNGALELVSSAL